MIVNEQVGRTRGFAWLAMILDKLDYNLLKKHIKALTIRGQVTATAIPGVWDREFLAFQHQFPHRLVFVRYCCSNLP